MIAGSSSMTECGSFLPLLLKNHARPNFAGNGADQLLLERTPVTKTYQKHTRAQQCRI
jgi:hypothetical protein